MKTAAARRVKPEGYVMILLHAHMPYVRHAEQEGVLEEAWLYEAITESYLPLLRALEELADRGVPYRLVLSLSTPLLSMLSDPLVQNRYPRYLSGLVELAEREAFRHRSRPLFQRLALYYRDQFLRCLTLFQQRYRCNLVAAFRQLADAGYLELWTSAATHAYLPLLAHYPRFVELQLSLALRAHRRAFQRPPQGFWLPECGYFQGLETALAHHGISCFCLESHGLTYARPRPRYAVYAPVRPPGGPAAFARDHQSAAAVWSPHVGYPGDPLYREFHRDIGYDLPPEELGAWWGAGQRAFTGLKYYRVTGSEDKAVYLPEAAAQRALEHARHFVSARLAQSRFLARWMDRPPLMVAPFDAELFGHWWYEGPLWLTHVLRMLAHPSSSLRLVTPSDYLALHPDLQPALPATSSWGEGGYHRVWLNPTNHWIWIQVHKAMARMSELARRFSRACGWTARALNQAARELLLAQSSDWAFIVKAGTAWDYAARRVQQHLDRFHKLCQQVEENRINPRELWLWEWQDNLFPDLDYRQLAPGRPSQPAGEGSPNPEACPVSR